MVAASVILLAPVGLYWTLLLRSAAPDAYEVGEEPCFRPECPTVAAAGIAAPPRGEMLASPEQRQRYRTALQSMAHYRLETDEFGCPNGPLLTAGVGGRLGGMMASYATLWAFHRRYGLRAWLLPSMHDQLTQYFDVNIPRLPAYCEVRWLQCTMRVDNCRKTAAKHSSRNIWIESFVNEIALYDEYSYEVRRELRLPLAARSYAELKLRRLQQSHSPGPANGLKRVLVGVHVRRNDYDLWLERRYKGRLLGPAYFRRAMTLYRSRYSSSGGCLFVVVSDDMEWCRQHLAAPDVALAGSGDVFDPVGDMALLAACDHAVLSYGAYGVLGAYLGGGDMVVPANFTRREMPVNAQLKRLKNQTITFIDMNQLGT